jgi:hypothetical protein
VTGAPVGRSQRSLLAQLGLVETNWRAVAAARPRPGDELAGRPAAAGRPLADVPVLAPGTGEIAGERSSGEGERTGAKLDCATQGSRFNNTSSMTLVSIRMRISRTFPSDIHPATVELERRMGRVGL